uniref:Uncharacterized protein n=1 Tax=Branchiostoma floridae TaxID=7739 RepID=C3ZL04_BRAFL|eukprot:XP_002590675.1 hypothetical protein BRAFLDRAFT_89476 [Branchiostoma floridae]
MEFLREGTPQPAALSCTTTESPTCRPVLYIVSAEVWLSQQVPSSLDPLCKYTSRCKVWGPQVWLSRQVPSSLDPLCKYTSRCKVWGPQYPLSWPQYLDACYACSTLSADHSAWTPAMHAVPTQLTTVPGLLLCMQYPLSWPQYLDSCCACSTH